MQPASRSSVLLPGPSPLVGLKQVSRFGPMHPLPFLQSPIFKYRWLNHLSFWLVYLTFFTVIGERGGEAPGAALLSELLLLPMKVAVVYLTLYALMPPTLRERRLGAFFVGMLLLLAGAAIAQRAIIYYILYPWQFPGMPYGEFWNLNNMVRYGLTILGVVLLAIAIKISHHWLKDQQVTKALEKEKLEAELKFLRAQIHPHFLFNTLNNLYALTLKKSDQAPAMVLRLSGLMNYMLYETSAGEVSLSKEIESLHHYISLEQIRYGQNLDLTFDITGDIQTTRIAPLILLPFVENSFKHGVSGELAEKWITVNLNVNHQFLTFKVANSCSRDEQPAEADYTGGIGLKNVRRRLELLYPGRYTLDIQRAEGTFLVVLQITLERYE